MLASKRSQFHYVATSSVETFALTKKFMSGTIFAKYPELERIMISESFARYVSTVRKPCTKLRVEKIKALNRKMLYSQISAQNSTDHIKSMKRLMSEASGSKGKFNVKLTPMQQNKVMYKKLLEEFNQKS